MLEACIFNSNIPFHFRFDMEPTCKYKGTYVWIMLDTLQLLIKSPMSLKAEDSLLLRTKDSVWDIRSRFVRPRFGLVLLDRTAFVPCASFRYEQFRWHRSLRLPKRHCTGRHRVEFHRPADIRAGCDCGLCRDDDNGNPLHHREASCQSEAFDVE